jgi:hypothetical protein
MKSNQSKILEYYPFLFILHTYLAFRVLNPDANIGLIKEDLLVMTIVLVISSLILFWLRKRILNPSRASLTLFSILYWASNYGSTLLLLEIGMKKHFSLFEQILLFIIWSLAWFYLCSNWLWKHIQKPITISIFMSLFLVLLVIISGWQLIQRSYQENQMKQDYPPLSTISLTKNNMPDIYYIITDGYGREDIYSSYYNMDNSPFSDSLRSRGFIVTSESHSNYIRTKLSIASSLNMSYLPFISYPSSGNKLIKNWIDNNVVMKSLEKIGYKIISFDSMYYYSNIQDADISIPTNLPQANLFKVILQTRSIGRLFLDLGLIKPIETYRDYQLLSYSQTNQLAQIAQLDGPKFVFIHFLQPHPSFIFNSKGPITPEKPYALVDADDVPLPKEEYIYYLREQTLYTNELLLRSIDNILKKSDNDPIIILQGDHGGGVYFYAGSVDKSCISERASILNAYYFPGEVALEIPENITPVNSFRVIFNTYFQANLHMLENKTYFSPINHEFFFTDVTDRLSETCPVH